MCGYTNDEALSVGIGMVSRGESSTDCSTKRFSSRFNCSRYVSSNYICSYYYSIINTNIIKSANEVNSLMKRYN